MRMVLSILFVIVATSFIAYGQTFIIDDFQGQRPDTLYATSMEGGTSLTTIYDPTDHAVGTGSLKVHTNIASFHTWGSYSQFGISQDAGDTPWDYSGSDSLSIWMKVRMEPVNKKWMSFRIELIDQPNPGDPRETYIYQNDVILDNAAGWVNLRVPIYEVPSTGSVAPNNTGFVYAPTNWGGLTWNNKKLDRNKIVSWVLVFVTTPPPDTTGNIPADSVEVSFDLFERFGYRPVPFIYFAGIVYDIHVHDIFTYGGASMTVANGAGTVADENAIQWVLGDGTCGGGANLAPAVNLAGAWPVDSLNFKMKVESGGPTAMRWQFESANGKRGLQFNAIADDQWHSYSLPLRNYIVVDNMPDFDSTAVTVFQVMVESGSVAGKNVFITQVWTGNLVKDVIPPNAVTGLAASGVTGGYSNIISWNPTNEVNSVYNVYFRETKFTSVTDPTVEDLVPYNSPATTATHVLRAPNTDQNVSYYYGVVATDASGNKSKPTIMKTAVTTLAKGVPTISLTPPSPFTADGNLSEWSSITPFVLSVVSNTAHGVPNFLVTDDNDLKVTAYLAVDASNLYVAFDVVDNIVMVDTSATVNDYEQDCPDLFIGMYDWRGKRHDGLAGGATPDYHIRFSKNRLRLDQNGSFILMYAYQDNPNYIWKKKPLAPGYTVEAKIPFTLLASMIPNRNDHVFVPIEGMRIPMDFAINDRDDLANSTRHAIMCYSTTTNDNSWQAMFYWTHTWIGNKWVPSGVVEQTSAEIPQHYELSQNYPNPFNPSTKIEYSLQKPGMVTLKVYDLLGREVTTLVNTYQVAGSYSIQFNSNQNAVSVASGIYFYRIESGSFVASKKMILLK